MSPSIKARGHDRVRPITAQGADGQHRGTGGAWLRGHGETGLEGPAFQRRGVVPRADGGDVQGGWN